MGVVHRHADLEHRVRGAAAIKHVREDVGVADGPLVDLLGLVVAEPALDDAVLELVERDEAVVGRLADLLRTAEVLHHVVAEILVEPLDVDRVERVLADLEPVAGDDGPADLLRAVHDEEVPAREERRGLRTEVGEDHAAELLHGVGGDRDPVFEGAVRVLSLLVRLLEAAAVRREPPAVVGAAQPLLLGDAEHHAGAAVRAAVAHEAEITGTIAVEHQVLAEEPNRLRAGPLEL